MRESLGKQRIGIHVPHAGERIASPLAALDVREGAGGFGGAAGGKEFLIQALFVFTNLFGVMPIRFQMAGQRAFAQPPDALGALGLVPGVRNVSVAAGEEFLFL